MKFQQYPLLHLSSVKYINSPAASLWPPIDQAELSNQLKWYNEKPCKPFQTSIAVLFNTGLFKNEKCPVQMSLVNYPKLFLWVKLFLTDRIFFGTSKLFQSIPIASKHASCNKTEKYAVSANLTIVAHKKY